MDILKSLSPEQLAVLSPEQLSAIVGKGSEFTSDFAKLRDIISNMGKRSCNKSRCSSHSSNDICKSCDCGYRNKTGRCEDCGKTSIKGDIIVDINKILLKYSHIKFYVTYNASKDQSNVLIEEEIKAKYPLIDIISNIPDKQGLGSDGAFMNQFDPITATNLVKVYHHVIQVYDYLTQNGITNYVEAKEQETQKEPSLDKTIRLGGYKGHTFTECVVQLHRNYYIKSIICPSKLIDGLLYAVRTTTLENRIKFYQVECKNGEIKLPGKPCSGFIISHNATALELRESDRIKILTGPMEEWD